ncbi:AsmA-like C-terminal region-containing protein [Hymenobacter sp. BT18]|uniref:AsmA-like C-terminal region-containing protein n=1 Tax=Hymenobacter sp. BT18 TaxID=2835648 RepID=UPI00143E93F4|nr:AsmA-like C-terminal region-containing protein [Hymenobacter sp. BT18]QIX63024.1 AsmA-like C-terminal region-containing protein [Hymenobacter sp. BT18]
MKRSTIPRLLAVLVLVVLLVVVGTAWLLGTRWGQRRVEALVRERVSQHSELVLAPFDVRFSLLREFPHLTASLHHLSLTDTSYGRRVEVLRVRRADARLEVSKLWRGEFRVSRLTVRDAAFRQYTDSVGHDWGLRGKGPRKATPATPPSFQLDSLILVNAHFQDRNELHRSGFAALVRRGSLAATVWHGVAHTKGRLQGELQYLRSGRGNLFAQEPMVALVHYKYAFRQRTGTFLSTRATLNGDTIRLSGTHQGAAPGQPRGTQLNLRFAGRQPLLEVLRVAFPPGLDRFLEKARSPSHAQIWYSIRGLSGPTARPRTVLRFALHNAQVQWADSARRIRRWDARGVFDNGVSHSPRTTSLTFEKCRLYSHAGELSARLTVYDFTQPHLYGRVQGRTELQTLASVLVPSLWRARRGEAALDLYLNGTFPTIPSRAARQVRQVDEELAPIAARGTVRLEDASFLIPGRGADIRRLNVLVRLQDSLWRLENLTGQLNGMQVQANATTQYLLAYFSGQHPTTNITGTFRVNELRLAELRRLVAPPAARQGIRPQTRALRRKHPQGVVTRALNFLPPGLRLNIQLQCGRLVLATDTLQNLAATVRHNGYRVQLADLRAKAWGGDLQGAVSWPTDITRPQPVAARLTVHFRQMQYTRLLSRITQPPRRAVKAPTDPTLRELLLAANGQATATIGALLLPGGDQLTNLQLRIDKNGPVFRVPRLTFQTSTGGTGLLAGTAQLQGSRLLSANADLELRYATLDVQHLLQLLAALSTVPEPAPDSLRRRGPRPASRPKPFLDGTVTGTVRVLADDIRYGALRGRQLSLRSSLEAGRVVVHECGLQALGGALHLRGQLQTLVTEQGQLPLHTQVRLQDIQLPELFGLASELGLDVLKPANIRGTMRSEADVHTLLDATFLPRLASTQAFLRTDLQGLELLNVEALMQTLKMLRKRRTSHVYFEPVRSRFILDGNRLLIPSLSLSSNLTDMAVTGEYTLDGRADLFVGLSPMQTLFGDNRQRVSRVQTGEAAKRPSRGLIYVHLRRAPGSRYQVRPFQKKAQRRQQAAILEQYQQLLRQQPLDTTLQLLQ